MNPAIMPILELLVGLFRKRRFIREEVLPLVETVNGLSDAAERRKLVVEALMHKGLTETEARLLTETGVRLWKKLEARRLKREAKRLKRAAKLAAREK